MPDEASPMMPLSGFLPADALPDWALAALSPWGLPWLAVLLPWLGAAVLSAIAVPRAAAGVNIAVAALTLAAAALLLGLPGEATGLLRAEALNLPLLLLAALVGLSGAVALALLPPHEGTARAFTAGYQLLLGATHLAVLADDFALMWMALVLAVMTVAMLAALMRGPAALAAAWKTVLLGGAGAGLALLGTMVLAMAAQPLTGDANALSFDAMLRVGREAESGLLTLGFVLLLAGYGVLAGLVPLHAWLPDAQAEAPTPLMAIPCALLGNAALLAVLRAQAVAALNPAWLPPGVLLLLAGLAGIGFAAAALWRQRQVGRFLAVCAIGQTGLAAFAFGLGGPAVMAGLLQMMGATLALSAAAFAIARASALRGGADGMLALSGLATTDPRLGWGLAAALGALAGLPPLAQFVSEFLLVQQAVARLPWMALPLGVGLVALAIATLARLRGLCFGPAPKGSHNSAPKDASISAPQGAHIRSAGGASIGVTEGVRAGRPAQTPEGAQAGTPTSMRAEMLAGPQVGIPDGVRAILPESMQAAVSETARANTPDDLPAGPPESARTHVPADMPASEAVGAILPDRAGGEAVSVLILLHLLALLALGLFLPGSLSALLAEAAKVAG
jgi:hydrogenase-4 component F